MAQENEQNAAGNPAPPPPQQNDMRKDEPTPPQKKRRIPPFVIIGAVALLVIIGLLFWWHSTFYEDTDDAQIAGHIDQLSARIIGQVQSVDVNEDQLVQAGQLLVELDPKDYESALQSAKAQLASKEAAWRAAQQNVPVQSTMSSTTISGTEADVRGATAQIDQAERQLEAAEAQVAAAAANAHKTDLDVERYTPLVQKDVISKQQYDAAVAAADANRATLLQAEANVSAQQQAVRVARDRLLQSQAQFRNAQSGPTQVAIQRSRSNQAQADYVQAQAQLVQAELNLSYTKIYAPYAGIVTKKNVEVGQNISVSQSILTLVSLDDLWVIANYKETQLRKMKPGQAAEINVDAYGRKYHGTVTEIGGATGSLLSLFPPENATGNYVKVVQRVPVRIDFTNLAEEDKDKFLRPGMSVEPTVTVK